jgi:Zn-dependent M16 (insulinase) family peptidase
MILEAMNIYNWRDYIGATPPEEADKIKELVMQQAQQLAQQEIGKLKEEIKIHLMAKQAAEMEFERQKFGQALAQSSQEPEQGSGQGAGSGGMVSL